MKEKMFAHVCYVSILSMEGKKFIYKLKEKIN